MAYITNLVKNVTGTTLYIEDALQQGFLYEGVNNITQTNNDLPFIINLDYYSQENPYYEKIYSQDDKNKIKIWFNNVELEDADIYVESLTRNARILPDDGSKVFSLGNFISTSIELILHNVDLDDIQDQVKISIGTLVSANTYEYVPLGIFNIQDTPQKDGNKITLKLRDNRVKFDFPYDAQPLLNSLGGVATKKQILDDICEQAGVENTIDSFFGENDNISTFDNSILGSTYVAYLMEQAGYIPVIDREGKLKKVDLSDLYTWRIPLSIIESYEIAEPYSIERVVYESGIIKYETSDDEELDTLYLNGANPYITYQEQVENILTKLQNFEIDSVTTKRVLGNPAIDPYDLIEVYNDLDNSNNIVFKTLANTTYTYNGVHRDTFDTQIGKENRKENVTIRSSDAQFKKVYTNIDQVKGDITLYAGQTQQYQQLNDERVGQLETRTNSVETRITSTEATISVMESNIQDSLENVRNTMVNININGINVSTNESAISTLINNEKFVVLNGNTPLAFIGYDSTDGVTKAQMEYLTVKTYFTVGHHRIESFEPSGENRTGWFYIG